MYGEDRTLNENNTLNTEAIHNPGTDAPPRDYKNCPSFPRVQLPCPLSSSPHSLFIDYPITAFSKWVSLRRLSQPVTVSTSPRRMKLSPCTIGDICTTLASLITRENSMLDFNFEGTITNQRNRFDNSYDRGQPLKVAIGTGRVIKGLCAVPLWILYSH